MDKGQTKQIAEYSPSRDFITLSDVVEGFRAWLPTYGYRLEPDHMGMICGHSLYRAKQVCIPGLNVPPGFHYWKEVRLTDPESRSDLNQLRHLLERYSFSESYKGIEDEDQQKRITQKLSCLAVCLSDDIRGVNALSKYAQGRKYHYRSTTLTAKSYHFRWVPDHSWFPESVRSLLPADLLTIFPKPEMRQFLLQLGRIVVGPQKSELVEGSIEHTYRNYSILIGLEAGMGKSLLLSYLVDALDLMGFYSKALGTEMGKFGWGRLATYPLLIVDDLNEATQLSLMTHPNIKPLITGRNPIYTEEKGERDEEVLPVATLIGCSNKFSYASHLKMDPGEKSRCQQLYTYSTAEIGREGRIENSWVKICKEQGTNRIVLAMWLIRLGVDAFLDAIGYDFDESGALYKAKEAKLEAQVKEDRRSFTLKADLTYVDELVSAHKWYTAACVLNLGRNAPRPEAWHFSTQAFFDIICLQTIDRPAEMHPDLWLKLQVPSMNKTTARLLANQKGIQALIQQKSPDEGLRMIAHAVQDSVSGFLYPGTFKAYAPMWNSSKSQVVSIIKANKDILRWQQTEVEEPAHSWLEVGESPVLPPAIAQKYLQELACC